MLVFYASFIRVTRLSSAVRQDSGKTPLIAWTHVSPRYTQFNSFGVKEADKHEEEGGVRESSHAENGRGFQPVLERESCYPNVFWLLAILQTEPLPRNAEWGGTRRSMKTFQMINWINSTGWSAKKKVLLLTSRKHSSVRFSLSYETDVFSALHKASLLWNETYHLAIWLLQIAQASEPASVMWIHRLAEGKLNAASMLTKYEYA